MRLIGHLDGTPIWEDESLPPRIGVIEVDDDDGPSCCRYCGEEGGDCGFVCC